MSLTSDKERKQVSLGLGLVRLGLGVRCIG